MKALGKEDRFMAHQVLDHLEALDPIVFEDQIHREAFEELKVLVLDIRDPKIVRLRGLHHNPPAKFDPKNKAEEIVERLFDVSDAFQLAVSGLLLNEAHPREKNDFEKAGIAVKMGNLKEAEYLYNQVVENDSGQHQRDAGLDCIRLVYKREFDRQETVSENAIFDFSLAGYDMDNVRKCLEIALKTMKASGDPIVRKIYFSDVERWYRKCPPGNVIHVEAWN